MEREKIYNQKGSILVSTLLILIVINLLAIGLMQSSAKGVQVAKFETLDSKVFHITDSCVQETMKWLGDLSTPTDTLPYVINNTSLDHLLIGDEGTDELLKLEDYSYNCSTTDIGIQSVQGDSIGTGEEIGESGGYGAAGDLSPRYYYEVTSQGTGPQNSSNRIIATVSVEY